MYTEVHLLTIPISNCEQAVAEMNAFLRGHKIIAVTKEFVATGENSFYSRGGFNTPTLALGLLIQSLPNT